MPRLGSEFLTSNQRIAYPFREDAEGLARSEAAVHGSSATLPLDFLADAVFFVPATIGLAYLVSIELNEYGNFNLAFASFGGMSLGVGEWNPSGSRIVSVSNGVISVGRVLMGDGAAAYCAGTTLDEFTTRLPFEAAVVEPLPARVNTIWFYDGVDPQISADNVTLVPGYNMTLSAASGDGDDQTVVTLSAAPGAGEGVVPVAEQTAYERITAPMSLKPDKMGGIRIVADDCYDLTPTGLDEYGAFQFTLTGSCYACCSCDDYVAMGKALKLLLDRTQVLHTLLTAAHQHYSTALADYDAYLVNVRRVVGEVKAVQGSAAAGSRFNLNVAINVVNKGLSAASGVRVTLTCIPAATVISGTYKAAQAPAGVCTADFTLPFPLPVGDSISMTYLLRLSAGTPIPAGLQVTLETATQLVGFIYNDAVEQQT